MFDGLVVGSSWVAQEIGRLLEAAVVLPERLRHHPMPVGVVINAVDRPVGKTPYQRWQWMTTTLAERILSQSYWIQVSTAAVLAGSKYQRPFRAAHPIFPLGLDGQIRAALEWALLSLGYPTAIARRSVLYSAAVEDTLPHWALDVARQEQAVVPRSTITPTAIEDFVKGLQWLMKEQRRGTFHVANRGSVTHKEIVRWTAERAGLPEPTILTEGGEFNMALVSNVRLRNWSIPYFDAIDDLTR